MARIGRYVIEKEIGRGSMGVVHLAHDPRLQRKVAIKTYTPPQGLPDPECREFRERFLREARAAAGLSHPGIVTLYDVDEDADSDALFLAMEWVPGRNLRRVLLEQGPLEPPRVFAMAGVLSDALHVAHNAGIVHRDLKPANLLVRESDGAVKLADFGVAHLVGSELTRSNASVGSPAYMSPEQVLGRAVDGRSDLFSLGIVLYEAFSGRRPFTSEEFVALAHSIDYEDPPPLSEHSPERMPGLDAFFRKALAKNPADRFEDGKCFRTALEKAASTVCDTQRVEVIRPEPEFAGAEPMALEETGETEEFTVPGSSARWLRRMGLRQWALAGTAVALLVVALLLRWQDGSQAAPAGDGPGITPGESTITLRSDSARPSTSLAYLEFDGRSMVPQGQFTLLVNGKPVYSRVLSRPKSKNVLQRVVQRTPETWGSRLELPAGEHTITARVHAENWTSSYEESITVVLEAGDSRSLHVIAGPVRKQHIELNLD
jgi:hypothetical protein